MSHELSSDLNVYVCMCVYLRICVCVPVNKYMFCVCVCVCECVCVCVCGYELVPLYEAVALVGASSTSIPLSYEQIFLV